MNVAETSQLIQLILNSVLMVVACVIVLSGLLIRHTAVNNRLRLISQEYFELMGYFDAEIPSDRALHLKTQLQQLRYRYKLTHSSVITVHYALLVLATSTLMMALRTVVSWNWLIVGSLALSVIGIGVLLLGIALALADIQATKQSLWHELGAIVTLGEGRLVARPRLGQPQARLLRGTPRRLVRAKPPSRADVV